MRTQIMPGVVIELSEPDWQARAEKAEQRVKDAQRRMHEATAEAAKLRGLVSRLLVHAGTEYERSWPDDSDFDALIAEAEEAIRN